MQPKPKFTDRRRTTQNADDYKVLVVGSICAILILLGSVFFDRLYEYRWFRDATKLTPFYSVHTHFSSVNHDTITVGGDMVKRRCVFNNFSAYVHDASGIRHRAFVDPSREVELTGASGNRPPSDTAETWGPWNVVVIDKRVIPVSWEIHVDHKDCPSPPLNQTNLFASGLWVTAMFEMRGHTLPPAPETEE